MNDDVRWAAFGVSGEFLEEKAGWLRKARNLHSSSLRFFEVAGTLFAFARYDYLLGSVAFFHAIPGLERALKLHYGDDQGPFAEQLGKAVKEGVITDAGFSHLRPHTEIFAKQVMRLIGCGCRSRAEELALLVPELRNQYFHGNYLLAPDYVDLTIQLREMADALTTKRRASPVVDGD